jgi:hypothetical protein
LVHEICSKQLSAMGVALLCWVAEQDGVRELHDG